MDERQDDQFLKKAFSQFENSDVPKASFNKIVLQRITAKRSLPALTIRYLKVIIPAFLILILGGVLLFALNAETIRIFVNTYLPMLKPWHIFVAFILVYFHFIRSMLILAFVYLRKQFTFASPFELEK